MNPDVKTDLIFKDKDARFIYASIDNLVSIKRLSEAWEDKLTTADIKMFKDLVFKNFDTLDVDDKEQYPDFKEKVNAFFKQEPEQIKNFIQDYCKIDSALSNSDTVTLTRSTESMVNDLNVPENADVDIFKKKDILWYRLEKRFLERVNEQDLTLLKKRDPDKSLAAYFEKPDLKALAAAINNGEPLKDGERLKKLVDRAADYTLPHTVELNNPKKVGELLEEYSQLIPSNTDKATVVFVNAHLEIIDFRNINADDSLAQIAEKLHCQQSNSCFLIVQEPHNESLFSNYEQVSEVMKLNTLDTCHVKTMNGKTVLLTKTNMEAAKPPMVLNIKDSKTIEKRLAFTDAEAKIIQNYHFNQLKKSDLSKGEGFLEYVYHMQQSGRFLNHEECIMVSLDENGKTLDVKNIGSGKLNGSTFNSKPFVDELMKKEVAQTFVFHNHPSGDPTPSPEDQKLAKEYEHMAKLFNKESSWYTVAHRGVINISRGTSYFLKKDDLLKYDEKRQGILRNRAKSSREPKWNL
ncbi:JAB domain-containing protein [Veillonella seminalis]|uniref:RadC-like JAB domain-containing protein n=1 Tax=Veillonella seminalis ACS-216-V-Col6b TaxID=883156 RepID=K9DEU3_9FIRM|nr:JAB domain-containing protein [Veillonella seminalis]EKU77377.1 hypothetical protein HMPREF9282_02094 [Veillonella seminalis ACS-216-V-Col6b]